MRTPSLRRRVLATGMGAMVVLLVATNVFVYVTMHTRLEATIAEVLDVRVALAQELAGTLDSGALEERLARRGIPAVVGPDAGAPEAAAPHPRSAAREVDLPDGRTLVVFASRAALEQTLRRLLVLMLAATGVALAVGGILLMRVVDTALAPLGQVVASARLTAGGDTGRRLRPDRPATELGRMAVAFDDMLDSLERALDEAQESEEATRRFLDDAAHQLRTPIAGIRAGVELLLQVEDPAEREQLLVQVVRETVRTSELITDLLRLARSEGGPPEARELVDIAALCGREAERVAALAPELDVRVDVPVQPAPAEVDHRGLREAVANLLDNARRHARTAVDIRLERHDGHLDLCVTDDGPGLTAAEAAQAFERFVSLDQHGGSGLGLPVAQAVARDHGGDLWWDGSGFRLRLPVGTGVGEGR